MEEDCEDLEDHDDDGEEKDEDDDGYLGAGEDDFAGDEDEKHDPGGGVRKRVTRLRRKRLRWMMWLWTPQCGG